MARRELIYNGALTTPDGGQVNAEVWWNGDLAIIFGPGGAELAVLAGMTRSMTEDNRLAFTGTTGSGEQTWTATPTEYTILNWVEQDVIWPDGGGTWAKATVTATNYRVTVSLRGQEPRQFLGAKAVDRWGRRWIVVDDQRIEVRPQRGCGCGK